MNFWLFLPVLVAGISLDAGTRHQMDVLGDEQAGQSISFQEASYLPRKLEIPTSAQLPKSNSIEKDVLVVEKSPIQMNHQGHELETGGEGIILVSELGSNGVVEAQQLQKQAQSRFHLQSSNNDNNVDKMNNNGISSTSSASNGGDASGDGSDNCESMSSVADSERCDYIASNCAPDGFFDYLNLYYCRGGGSKTKQIGISVFLILWMLFLFVLLASTADGFFCPPLTHLADGFKFSPRLAGCTLLALGNGSPDIFSTIAALQNDDPSAPLGSRSLELSLGALSGAGVFVTCVVFGAVLVAARGTHARGAFVRDVIAYLITVSGAFFIFWKSKMSFWQPVVFLIFYVGYVAVVAGADRYSTVQKRKASLKWDSINADPLLSSTTLTFPPSEAPSGAAENGGHSHGLARHQSHCNFDPIPADEEQEELGRDLLAHTHEPAARWKVMAEAAWEEKGIVGKILLILELPMTLIRILSVPMADEAHWHRYTCCFSIACFPLFVLLYLYKEQNMDFIGGKFPNPAIAGLVGAVFATAFFLTTVDKHPPKYHLAVGTLGFLSAAMWMDIIADEIVSLLTVLGQVFGISKDLMGLTVLAWANSIGDLVADVTVARQGRANMATTACFAGPLFNMLVGLGVGFLVVLPSRASSYSAGMTGTNVLTFAFLVASLLSSLLASVLLKQHIPWQHGVYLLVLYILFALLTILHQVNLLPIPDLQP